MKSDKIVISGTGCALADFLYSNISFNSPEYLLYLSKKTGDGGLSPGKLVFTEEFEKFSGKPYTEILKEITGNKEPDAFNIGGPGLVSLIHSAQLLGKDNFDVKFYGSLGMDLTAQKIMSKVKQTPLNTSNYLPINDKSSPFTDVFSDPNYDQGNGERSFVNNIGAAWNYSPDMIPEDFFESQIVCFGGTALVPLIHTRLTPLLEKAKLNGCITIVNTVFDFLSEKRNPDLPWPLGESNESYQWIDLLVMNHEEALKISGQNSLEDAIAYFKKTKLKSFIITNGANPVRAYSNGMFFKENGLFTYNVLPHLTDEFRKHGDTTGCGDNFAGGIIFSLAEQLKFKHGNLFNLHEAISWAIASGGFACSYLGGTYFEKYPGEKRTKIQNIINS